MISHGKKEKNIFKCEYCGYATDRRDCINRHNLTLIHNQNVTNNAKNGIIDYSSESSSNSLLDSLRPPSIVRATPIKNGQNSFINRPKRMTPQYLQYLAIAQQFQKPIVKPFAQPIVQPIIQPISQPVSHFISKPIIKPTTPLVKFEHLPLFSKVDAECPACNFTTPCKFTLKNHLVEHHEDYLIKEYNLNFDYSLRRA